MPSYDVHQHLWPPALVEALRARRTPPRLDGDVLVLEEGSFPLDLREHELERRLRLLDRDGIDTALVSLAPTLDCASHTELRDAYHEGIASLVAAADGRLAAFADGICLEGFVGACVPATAVVTGLGSLPEELERAGQVLFVHPEPPEPPPGGAAEWWTALTDYTAQMQAAYLAWLADGAARLPRLPVIFAILAGGGPFQLERLGARAAAAPAPTPANVYLETASYGRRALELCIAAVGSGQLLYGSDAPVIDTRPTLQALSELGETTRSAILRENPARLFAA